MITAMTETKNKIDTRETTLHRAAKRRMNEIEHRGIFRSDWLRALFIHFELDPSLVQSQTPFELDLHRDRACVSLVAFLMRRFRPRGTGVLGSMLFAPVARHALLNVRTYIRHGNERGIFFLAEFIPNPLSVLLGPRLFGLPYQKARLRYAHNHDDDRLEGDVRTKIGSLRYRASIDRSDGFRAANRASFEEFLLERHTAFTSIDGNRGLFRIWHGPWHVKPADVSFLDRSLIENALPWLASAELVGAHYSPGVRDVWIGRHRRLP